MPISDNFSSILNKNFEINFMQCLPNGLLKMTELCNMLQLTAAEHSEIGGISFIDMQQFDQAWVLSRMRLEVIKMPKWKDNINIKTWICNLENSRSVRAFEVYLNDKKMIGAETFWAVFNTKTRRPESLNLQHEHFEKFNNIRGTKSGVSKIIFPENSSLVADKTIQLSDLDMVNHVNNVKYLEWCMDLIDEKLILDQQIESLDFNFLKELSLKDNVTIEESQSQRTIFFNVIKELKPVFLLQINLF